MRNSYGTAYVVADDPSAAYRALLTDLNRRALGLSQDKELDRVELLAEVADYPRCGTALFLPAPADRGEKG